jgi:hypothetical protein
MKVEIFTVCDAATVDLAGSLNILGAFDTLNALQAPFVHPEWALAIRCRFERIEVGTKKLRLSIVDPCGTPIIQTLERQIKIHIAPNLSATSFTIVVMMVRTKLPSFGDYSINLALDGRHEASIPMYVRQALSLPPGTRSCVCVPASDCCYIPAAPSRKRGCKAL